MGRVIRVLDFAWVDVCRGNDFWEEVGEMYFGEQGLSIGIQECLERFPPNWADYLCRQIGPE